MTPLPRLFPYFGGKLTVLPEVQRRFGRVFRLIEPFAGSAAIGINYEPRPRYVILNDLNGLIVNVWRSVKHDPDGVLEAADRPIAELELRAIHKRMMEWAQGLPERLRADPDYYDSEMAGWWIWGQSGYFGDAWSRDFYNGPPRLTGFHGINALRFAGTDRSILEQYSSALHLSIITCGEWQRCTSDVTLEHDTSLTNTVGIFLDPPYGAEDVGEIYGKHDSTTIAHDVRAWCLEHGDNPCLRIALCGYDEHDELAQAGWVAYRWKANGGYGNQRKQGENTNAHRETIWFSPHCTNVVQGRMF